MQHRQAVRSGLVGPAVALALVALVPGPAAAEGTADTTPKGSTALAATEIIEGRLLEAGVECPQFRLDAGADEASAGAQAPGEVISLTGAAPQDLGPYRLTGRWARFSYCMQGRSFDVRSYAATGTR